MSAEDHGPAAALESSLAGALYGTLGAVEVSALHRMTGGASRETWSHDATDTRGVVHELVLRRDPPARPGAPGAMRREAATMRAATQAGLPVPEVLVEFEEPSPWGGAGMVMRRVGGETIARRILRDDRYATARPLLAAQCGSALAALHGVDPEVVPGLVDTDPLALLRALLDSLDEPVPTFEYALQWLQQHRPDPVGRSIVHGDFRLGNLIVDESGLRAVLDWELVHVGDPIEDLGWLCVKAWRFGAAPAVGGFGSRRELIDAYVAAGGSPVGLETLRWWEVQGTLRWGAICLMQSAVHLRGDLRSVELAAIGRRVCETEWDLLLLLEPASARVALDHHLSTVADTTPDGVGADIDAGASDGGVHGRPTSAELVTAVREFLAEQVMPATEGALSFHARVAANVLGMVERELAGAGEQEPLRADGLGRLGITSERELCEMIRQQGVGGREQDLIEVLASGVVTRVSVANPEYLSIPAG